MIFNGHENKHMSDLKIDKNRYAWADKSLIELLNLSLSNISLEHKAIYNYFPSRVISD